MSFKEDSFMQPFVTTKQKWYEVETSNGTEVVPFDLVGEIVLPAEDEDHAAFVEEHAYLWDHTPQNEEPWELHKALVTTKALRDYVLGDTIFDYSIKEGYGARMSAAGYMDCTEWSVFDTPEKAMEHLEEMYGDEEEDEDPNEEEVRVQIVHDEMDEDEDDEECAYDTLPAVKEIRVWNGHDGREEVVSVCAECEQRAKEEGLYRGEVGEPDAAGPYCPLPREDGDEGPIVNLPEYNPMWNGMLDQSGSMSHDPNEEKLAQAMFDAASEAQECLYVDCHKDCAPDSDYCVDHADYEKTTFKA